MHEIELKMPLADPAVVRGRLRALHAAYLGRVHEVNRLLDRADAQLRSAGRALRLRTAIWLDEPAQPAGAAVAPPSREQPQPIEVHTLTLKGPAGSGPVKTRSEIEVRLSDAGPLLQILACLGYETTFLFEKRRETWRGLDALITLDELPYLGWYLEIEAESEEKVLAACKALGLADRACEQRTYVEILAAAERPSGAAQEFRFEGDAIGGVRLSSRRT